MSYRSNIETLKEFLEVPPAAEVPKLTSKQRWLLKNKPLRTPITKGLYKWESDQIDEYLNTKRN